MNAISPRFQFEVDASNPGQFFACCGLLELARRLWPSAEGWFDSPERFCLAEATGGIFCLISAFSSARIAAPSEDIRARLQAKKQALADEKKTLKEEAKKCEKRGNAVATGVIDRLADIDDALQNFNLRLEELASAARKAELTIGEPFSLRLDWWDVDNEIVPKTWAGQQEIGKIAKAAQLAVSKIDSDPTKLFDQCCVMRDGLNKKVEPFYFDARRFASALDTGFSLDVQEAQVIAYPAVELLSLVGLQRFRPVSRGGWSFDYHLWARPLGPAVAAAVAAGAVPGATARYRFQLRFRDQKKQYKAFGFGTRLEI